MGTDVPRQAHDMHGNGYRVAFNNANRRVGQCGVMSSRDAEADQGTDPDRGGDRVREHGYPRPSASTESTACGS